MKQQIKDHITSLLSAEDITLVQQGCTLLAQHVESEQELCDFFGTQREEGFSPIAGVIARWPKTKAIYEELQNLGDRQKIGLIQNRERHYHIRFVDPHNYTYQFALLSQEGFEFWKDSSLDLDEYINRFEYGSDVEAVPPEADFCNKDNWENWEEDWCLGECLGYEDFYITIAEQLNGTTIQYVYEGSLFELKEHGTVMSDDSIEVREIPEPDTPIQPSDTFRMFCLGHWRSGLGFYMDLSTTSDFEFSKLVIEPSFDEYHGKLLLYRESILYDDLECEIELDGTVLKYNKWVCTRRSDLYEMIEDNKTSG